MWLVNAWVGWMIDWQVVWFIDWLIDEWLDSVIDEWQDEFINERSNWLIDECSTLSICKRFDLMINALLALLVNKGSNWIDWVTNDLILKKECFIYCWMNYWLIVYWTKLLIKGRMNSLMN